jgi:hypothetical protein
MYELLSIDVIHQFVTLDCLYPTVGKRHEYARGHQSLQHLFVAMADIVGREFGNCGTRTRVSFCHDYSSSVMRYMRARGAQTSLVGEIEMPKPRCRLIPARTGAGQVIRHREVG